MGLHVERSLTDGRTSCRAVRHVRRGTNRPPNAEPYALFPPHVDDKRQFVPIDMKRALTESARITASCTSTPRWKRMYTGKLGTSR